MVNARLYPWLYIILSILIPLTPIVVGGVDLTYVRKALKQGAVCLDGSPAAYQFDEGVGDGTHNWLIFLEGGGWCNSIQSCQNRTNNTEGLGSSDHMTAKNFTGILSNEQQLNPDFYDWNRVFVRYCDGASYTGNKVDPVHKLNYKGAKIFDSIVKELLRKGMHNASKALLAGCSAGGLGATLNCYKFRSLLPATTIVKCASDAGYFIHIKDVFGEYHFAQYFEQIVNLHGSTKRLPKSCTSMMNRKSLCFYPQYVIPLIRTPFFLINSAYDSFQIQSIFAPSAYDKNKEWKECKSDVRMCSKRQLQRLKDKFIKLIITPQGRITWAPKLFIYNLEQKSQFLQALPKRADGLFRGMFIDSCQTHCQTQFQQKWYGNHAPRFDNKTIAEALGDWFYGRGPFKKIDYENELPKICD